MCLVVLRSTPSSGPEALIKGRSREFLPPGCWEQPQEPCADWPF